MILTLNCCYIILANRRQQKDWFLRKNMHQGMSRNWENSCNMLQSSPKFLFCFVFFVLFTSSSSTLRGLVKNLNGNENKNMNININYSMLIGWQLLTASIVIPSKNFQKCVLTSSKMYILLPIFLLKFCVFCNVIVILLVHIGQNFQVISEIIFQEFLLLVYV